jgi:hypothetical protein
VAERGRQAEIGGRLLPAVDGTEPQIQIQIRKRNEARIGEMRR